MTSQQPILKTIIQFFEEDGWPFSILEQESALTTGFQGKNGQWKCYAEAREKQQQFRFYSIFPFDIPENKRLAIAEFLTRANYGLIIGNFEMDLEDGEIRYKTSAIAEANTLTLSLLKELVYTNVLTMDKYFPGMMSIISVDISPSAALDALEE
jgi:hypothetical protein